MRRIKKAPNVARKSGYTQAEVGPALASYANRRLKGSADKTLKTDGLSDEQKTRLRAAGYLNIEKESE